MNPSVPPENDDPIRQEIRSDNAAWVLQVVEARRRDFGQVMWQVPALSIAGQAFLFSVALNQDTPAWGKVTVLVPGFLAAIAALLLLLRQRFLEDVHRAVVERCAEELGMPALDRVKLEELLPSAQQLTRWREWRPLKILAGEQRAFWSWLATLTAFAAADLVVLGSVVL